MAIVNEYKRPDQFVTQNFDLDWRDYSYSVQPDVDHFAAARAFDLAGIDIYHPSQSQLAGTEIAFGGDLARSLKGTNYLVMETQAQGFPQWTPYPGQLRLQAFSHLASGANMVEYWHWHSIHNAAETYWKGLLSHDFEPNPVYDEAKTIGRDFACLSSRLVNLRKTNKVALLVSNEALTALEWFKLPDAHRNYNDIDRVHGPQDPVIAEHEPTVYAQARRGLLPKDHMRYRLSGDYAMDKAGALAIGLRRERGR